MRLLSNECIQTPTFNNCKRKVNVIIKTLRIVIIHTGNDCTFGVTLTDNVKGPAFPLLLNQIYANRLNGWVPASDSCRVGLNQTISFVEICAGIPGRNATELQTTGGYPTPISFQWLSTSQDDVETGCRSAIVSLSSGASISLQLTKGSVYSLEQQTGWSSFSVSNTIFDVGHIFSGYSKSKDAYEGLVNFFF